MKYFSLFIILLLPVIAFATGGGGGQVDYFQGDNAFESWFMDAFAELDLNVWEEANQVKRLGQAIGAIGALIYLSYLGWQMAEGARSWDVTPMIRPIMVAIILSNWSGFCNMIQYPFEQAANPAIAKFNEIQAEAEDRRDARYLKQVQLLDAVIAAQAAEKARIEEAEALANADEDGVFSNVDFGIGDLSDLFQPVQEWLIRFDYDFQRSIANLIDTGCLGIMRISTYFIFMLQKIWGYILITLGPIAIGMSLIPGFENSFNSWVAKFLNINLYTFIAYNIINVGQIMITGTYTMEINRLDSIINDEGIPTDIGTLTNYITNQGFISTVMFTAVAYLVTAVLILMTPTIADSIVSAGGSSIMSQARKDSGTVKGAAGRAATAGGSVIRASTAAAAQGARAAASAVRTAARNIKP